MNCADTLGPGLAALSSAISTGKVTGTKIYAKYLQSCPRRAAAEMQKEAIHKIDDKAMCQVMCCCRNVLPVNGKQYKQNCVAATVKRADELLGHQSRYKAEISYRMDTTPPGPFMHRDAQGDDTTQGSEGWIGRARREIAGYQPGQDMVRRVDVVIVDDPSQPPIQSNIDRIVEMKFEGDREQDGQYRDYGKIAGSRDKLKVVQEDAGDCNCRPNDAEPDPVLAPNSEYEMERSPNYLAYAALGAAAVVMAGAVIAAVLIPPSAPADAEVGAAAASTFAAAWASIFGTGAAVAGAMP